MSWIRTLPVSWPVQRSPEERLSKTRLSLQAAIAKTYRTSTPKKDVMFEEIEDKVHILEKKLKKLLGDSFQVTWKTVNQLRNLDEDGLLSVPKPVLVAFCKTHLSRQDLPPPWQYFQFCSWLGLEEHRSATDTFLKRHFKEASEYSDFVLLPPSVLAAYLTSVDLQLEREVDAFRALFKWLQHDPTKRTIQAKLILDLLNVHRLNQEEMAEIDAVCKFFQEPIVNVRQRFDLRQTRFEAWIHRYGIHVVLALALKKQVELSQLDATRRRWERRRTILYPMFHLECLTGSIQKLYIIGDDEGIVLRNGKDSAKMFSLNPEILGPVAYRYVEHELFVVQNLGSRLKVWVKEGLGWILLGRWSTSSWMYYIQLFANQEYLVIVGQRDKTVGCMSDDLECPCNISNALGPKEPFICIFNRITGDFDVTPSCPAPDDCILHLGCTAKKFWVADPETGKIWGLDLTLKRWAETSLFFPKDDRVLCSSYTSHFLFILSGNTVRGAYLTLSALKINPALEVGVVGTIPLQFEKSFSSDFLNSARFHIIAEANE